VNEVLDAAADRGVVLADLENPQGRSLTLARRGRATPLLSESVAIVGSPRRGVRRPDASATPIGVKRYYRHV
jgi:hypothetical protein